MNREQCLARWTSYYDSLATPHHPSHTPIPNDTIPQNSFSFISPPVPNYLSSPIHINTMPEPPAHQAFDLADGDLFLPNNCFDPATASPPSQILTGSQENPKLDSLEDWVAEPSYDCPDHSGASSLTASQLSAPFESSLDAIMLRDSPSLSEQALDSAVEELYETAAHVVKTGQTDFQFLLQHQTDRGSIVFPFTTRSEYQLATWLNNTGLSRNDMASFFKLDTVSLHYISYPVGISDFTLSLSSILLHLPLLKPLKK